MSGFFSAVWTSVIEYETPRLVKIHNRKVGLVRRIIQLGIVLYVAIYALWLQRGYQVSDSKNRGFLNYFASEVNS